MLDAFDQRGGVRVVAAEATGASRCSLRVVLVLAAGMSTGYGSRSAPGLRWPTSRYRRSWACSSSAVLRYEVSSDRGDVASLVVEALHELCPVRDREDDLVAETVDKPAGAGMGRWPGR